MCVYIYIYISIWMNAVMRAPAHLSYTANLHTKILDFGGFDSSRIVNCKGWNYQVHREYP